MSVNSGLKATKIIGQRKAFYRQKIPEFSRARKEIAWYFSDELILMTAVTIMDVYFSLMFYWFIKPSWWAFFALTAA